MTDEFKARVADEMVDIAICPGEEIVDAENIMTVSKEAIAEVRAKKSGPPVMRMVFLDITPALSFRIAHSNFGLFEARRQQEPASYGGPGMLPHFG